jgi:hypothetical protein
LTGRTVDLPNERIETMKLITIRQTEHYGGSYTIEVLPDGNCVSQDIADCQTERAAKAQVTRKLNRSGGDQYQVVTPEEMDAEKARRKAEWQRSRGK